MTKGEKHLIHNVLLDTNAMILSEDGKDVLDNTPKRIVKHLEKVIASIEQSQNCKGCGGLAEELGISYKGKEYRFCCYEIRNEKDAKILKKTNYEQLGEWCRVFHPKKKES